MFEQWFNEKMMHYKKVLYCRDQMDRLGHTPYIVTTLGPFERAANARIWFMEVRPNRSIWSRQYSK